MNTAVLAFRSTTGSPCECIPDTNADRAVDGNDLATVLGIWGPTAIGAVADFDGNRLIDGFDLAAIVCGWGLCY